MKFIKIISLILCCIALQSVIGQVSNNSYRSQVWVADNGDGTYKNPILFADYSDPDVIRVGDDYYMTSSSFNAVPGLPILHSKDMINWELINYALQKQPPFDVYDKPGHGNGVWAPCIRYHNNEFYIYYPDPDYGIYMVKTKDPKATWSEPILVKEGKGLIDPSPLWDDDGKVYLGYAFAGSRAGIKSLLAICTMNSEGTLANSDDVIIIDGHEGETTIEGPKLYKRNGYYYVFAPAGGVPIGWQTVMRSKNIYGPYEKRKVLEQGKTTINGPHQGAWVTTQTGEDWFFHFQDRGAYGRIVHLQPMKWVNDWPIMGTDQDGNGIGEPVLNYKKPNVGNKKLSIETPPESDEFNSPSLGLQWQWHANKQVYWGFPSTMGYYTLYCQPMPKEATNLWDVGNLLLQKFPAEEFTATTKMTFNARFDEEQTGLLIMGLDYSYLRVLQKSGELYVSQVSCKDADKKGVEKESDSVKLKSNTFYLQVRVTKGGICKFFYSEDGTKFNPIGEPFTAREGKWIGAKIGFLALRKGVINDAGNVLIDWFRINK
ncbi:glycoside hydrolase family 43 protein [Flavobacterium cellulosilyticum]|uniref:Glycosyl hydrolase 43 family protein n=1 Tax=Flavobacterium cellulosilyticum TaxID=2541731 RepID=A0A4R5CAG5_9FLAO|nr:glycoside hydrolase 43 family protein [Flavobacterium cellulosilyticum]TDD94084.1 glycosyl hydrolase 43 family protein [Flavobacterium cellulosilyticum]